MNWNRKKIAHQRQRGSLVLQYILGSVIAMILTAAYIISISQAAITNRTAAANNQLQAIEAASALYLQSLDYVSSNFVAGSSIEVPIGRISVGDVETGTYGTPSVQGAGFLSPDFIDQDPFGQRHYLIISQPTAGTYHAIVVSYGGTSLSTSRLGQIIQNTDGAGGIIAAPTSGTVDLLQGVSGRWSGVASTYYSSNVSSAYFQTGHYVVTLDFNASSSGISAYLNRYSVSGQPEANRMHTGILMNGNSVTGLSNVSFNHGTSIADDTAGGLTITGPTLTSGTLSEANNTVSGNQTTGTETIAGNSSVGGTETVPSGSTINQEGLSPIGTAGDACSPLGAMASSTDGNGIILACENTTGSNLWTSLEGVSNAFDGYLSLGCSQNDELAWNNTLNRPVALYMGNVDEGNVGSLYNYTYDQYGNIVSQQNYFIANGGRGYLALPSIIPPYGSVQLYSTAGGFCGVYIKY